MGKCALMALSEHTHWVSHYPQLPEKLDNGEILKGPLQGETIGIYTKVYTTQKRYSLD